MRITRNELIVGFGLWAGCSALVAIVGGVLHDIQWALMPADATEPPLLISDYPAIGGGLTLLLACAIAADARTKLLLMFAGFAVLFEFTQSLFYVVSAMLCDGSGCYVDEAFLAQMGWPQLHLFEARKLLPELAGYGLGWLILMIVLYRTGSGRSLGGATLYRLLGWLEFDTEEQSRFWRWWLSLPLWNYAARIKNALSKLWPPFFAVAATLAFGGLVSLHLSAFLVHYSVWDAGSSDGAQDGYANVATFAHMLPMLLVALSAGRLARDTGYAFSPVATFAAYLFFQLHWLIAFATNPSTVDLGIGVWLSIEMLVVCVGLWFGNRRAPPPTAVPA